MAATRQPAPETAPTALVIAHGNGPRVGLPAPRGSVSAAVDAYPLNVLGASILNIVSGIPFLPLQTLWVNFTTQVFQSVGLGYGRSSTGMMERRPRKPEKPILTRADTRWFIVAGLVMAAATIVFATELRCFQRILDTKELSGNQWLICIGAALSILAVSELRKAMLRRHA